MGLMTNEEIVAELNRLCENSLIDHLGIQFTEYTGNSITAFIEIKAHHFQPMGVVHGGVYLAFAESLAGAGSSLIAREEGKVALGASVSGQHIAPVSSGTIWGIARLTYRGITKHIWDIEIRDSNDKLISISRVNNSIKELNQSKD